MKICNCLACCCTCNAWCSGCCSWYHISSFIICFRYCIYTIWAVALSSGIIILLYPSLTSSASQKAFTCPITVLIPCRQLIQPDKHKNGVQQKHKRSKINLTPWLLLHY